MLTLKKNEQILCCRRHTWKITTQKRCCVLLVIVQMQIRTIEVVKLTVFAMATLPHMKWDLKSSAQLVGMIKSQLWKATWHFFKMHTYFKVCPFHFLVSLKSRETIHHALVGNIDGSSTCNQLPLLVRNTHISLHRRMDKLIEISKQQNIM